MTAGSLSFIRDAGNLIAHLPFRSFQYLSPAQVTAPTPHKDTWTDLAPVNPQTAQLGKMPMLAAGSLLETWPRGLLSINKHRNTWIKNGCVVDCGANTITERFFAAVHMNRTFQNTQINVKYNLQFGKQIRICRIYLETLRNCESISQIITKQQKQQLTHWIKHDILK